MTLTPEQQTDYIKRHPGTKLKPNANMKNVGLRAAGQKDLTPEQQRKATFAATAETKSILRRTSDENLMKMAADMQNFQEGKTLSSKAGRTLARLAGAAFGAAVAATAYMTPFPELSQVGGAYAVYKITGKRPPGLPDWLDEEAAADRKAEKQAKKTGLSITKEEYADPELFREALIRTVNENLPNLNPKVAEILIEQRKKNT